MRVYVSAGFMPGKIGLTVMKLHKTQKKGEIVKPGYSSRDTRVQYVSCVCWGPCRVSRDISSVVRTHFNSGGDHTTTLTSEGTIASIAGK